MNTLTFLNQPLLWGLALASIPLIIHLLYRRQYRRVDWAPMRYLKLSIERNRRRVRIEQLLLLLLRTMLVLLLFFLVARPVMHAEGLSRLWGANARANRILLLDDTLSMGYTSDGKTALARGQEIAVELLSTFGQKDAFTLVRASAPKAPVLREVELDRVDDVAREIRAVEPTEVFGAWEPILQAIDELVQGGSYPLHEVTLITDMRQAGWDASLVELGSRWAAGRVRLRIFDVGASESANVALIDLLQVDRLALAATPTRFEAQVRNDTLGELAALEANFIVDGKASLVRLPKMAAGETIRLPLTATFQEPGPHQVAFELPLDALPGDNARTAIVEVQQTIEMILVDGEPSSDALGGETEFLALALSLPGETTEAFRVEILTDSEWASLPQTRPDLLVLANVAHLSAEQVGALERQVSAGMGLVIFVGDQVDPDNYNQLLFKGGLGLLPAALEAPADAEFSGLLIEAVEGSPLESLAQLSAAALGRIKVRKSYDVRLGEDAEAGRVLARWNNQAAAPAAIQKVFGQGQVLLWTTAADRAWSDWPADPSYVLAMRESARAVARASGGSHAFVAGQTLKVELPPTHEIATPAIELPRVKEPKPLALQEETGPSGASASEPRPGKTLVYRDTARAGVYKMTWRDSVSGPMSELFAVDPDARESHLQRMTSETIAPLFGALQPEVISVGTGGDTELAVRGEEIWRTLATGLLGLLVFEACFARWTGRQR